MTTTMLGEAEVMPGLGPAPLLQRKSAVESRWTRTVPTSREKTFRECPFLSPGEMEVAPVCYFYRYAGPGESKHPRAVESKSGIYHFLVVEIPLGLQHRKSRNPRLSRQNFIGQPIAGMKYDIGEVGFQRAQQAQESLGISCGGFLLRILNFGIFVADFATSSADNGESS